jgi:Fur family peroxide stress response transcriptional regulator
LGSTVINANELKNSIVARLREAGLKLTSQRLVVITELVNDKSHPSALDIYRKARAKVPAISLSTVYHILGLLKKHKLIKELEFEGMDNRYEADTRSHLNLVCSECGKIEDFALDLPVPVEMVHKETGFRALETRIEYYGLCRECNKTR